MIGCVKFYRILCYARILKVNLYLHNLGVQDLTDISCWNCNTWLRKWTCRKYHRRWDPDICQLRGLKKENISDSGYGLISLHLRFMTIFKIIFSSRHTWTASFDWPWPWKGFRDFSSSKSRQCPKGYGWSDNCKFKWSMTFLNCSKRTTARSGRNINTGYVTYKAYSWTIIMNILNAKVILLNYLINKFKNNILQLWNLN